MCCMFFVMENAKPARAVMERVVSSALNLLSLVVFQLMFPLCRK